MNIPMPLRVPELAPSLGRVIVARRREPPWVPLDDIREELATAVLELAGEGRRAAARRLEAAWLALEGEVEEERRRWTPEIETLTRWRPALWPVALLWAPIAAALIWLGLVLGGYLPAPEWLAQRLGF